MCVKQFDVIAREITVIMIKVQSIFGYSTHIFTGHAFIKSDLEEMNTNL